MKKILKNYASALAVLVMVIAIQVITLNWLDSKVHAQNTTRLNNGWRTGATVPSSCTPGIDSPFLQTTTNILFECAAPDNTYSQVLPGWKKYVLSAIANGTGGCAATNGCWAINGVFTGASKAAALTQQIAIFTLPANAYVSSIRVATNTAFTGAATSVVSNIGTGSSASYYGSMLSYDLTAAVSNTNFLDVALGGEDNGRPGNNSQASQSFTVTITNTMNNITSLATGSAVTFFIKWEIIPQ